MIRQQNIKSNVPVENQIQMHKAMEKYNIDWWNSADLKQVARYQLYEKTLLVDLDVFHEGMTLLLDRPVQLSEFADPDSLKREYENRNEANQRIEYALSNIRKALELVSDCGIVGCSDEVTIMIYGQLKHAEYHLTRSE